MTVKTRATFDLEAFKARLRGVGHRGPARPLRRRRRVVQIDRDNPPSAPRIRQGKDVFRGMFEHCAAAGVRRPWKPCRRRGSRRRHGDLRVPGGPQGPRQRDLRDRGRPHRP